MKQVYLHFKWIPEFYFILVSIFWFYISVQNGDNSTGQFMNFPAIIFIVLFHIQLFLDDRILGKILAFVVTIASFYLIYAMFDDLYADFEFNEQANLYILQAGNLILFNFLMAYLMYSKYRNNTLSESELV